MMRSWKVLVGVELIEMMLPEGENLMELVRMLVRRIWRCSGEIRTETLGGQVRLVVSC